MERSGDPALTWFPKPFLEGDLDGEGAEKVLGRSSTLDQQEILVRETAQNSWDARLRGAQEIEFELHLRRTSADQQRLLGERVFTGDRDRLRHALPNVESVFGSDGLWVLEIHDRRTKGLGGPASSRVTPAPGDVTDFRDLVLNIGSPRDQDHGGGTYGFGKTAAYKASRCASLLIWTAYRDIRGVGRTRLIASAMGHSFDMNGIRYTGRHWWGLPGEADGTFLPASESWAGELGGNLFSRQFGDGLTGTSIMIIDPDMGDLSPRAYVEKLSAAVLKHLWPKIHPQSGRPLMRIRILYEGAEVPIPEPATHPVLRHFTQALDAVRAAQSGGEVNPSVRVFPISGRPRGVGQTTLGHLAVVAFPHAAAAKEFMGVETLNHVSLMRNQAELVVKYQADRPHPNDRVSWVGVFKPLLEHDDAFADAEPPAHDEWAAESVTDAVHKSVVNVTLNKIAGELKAWTSPQIDAPSTPGALQPAAVLADALSGLLPGVKGSAVRRSSRAGTSKSSKGGTKPKAVVTRVMTEDLNAHSRVWLLRVHLSAPPAVRCFVDPRLGVATVDKDDFDVEGLRVIGWDSSETVPDIASDPEEGTEGRFWLYGDESWWLRVEAPLAYALSVDLRAEIMDDSEEV